MFVRKIRIEKNELVVLPVTCELFVNLSFLYLLDLVLLQNIHIIEQQLNCDNISKLCSNFAYFSSKAFLILLKAMIFAPAILQILEV